MKNTKYWFLFMTFLNVVKLPMSFKGASAVLYHITQVDYFHNLMVSDLSPLLSGFVSCDFLIFVLE